jgi:hypothetical protein
VASGAGAGSHIEGAYAAHAVAAAFYEALAGTSRPAQVMSRMIGLLAAMHDRNPGWEDRGRTASPSSEVASDSRVA